MITGTPSETAPIRELLLKHPRQAWLGQENVRGQWTALGYTRDARLRQGL